MREIEVLEWSAPEFTHCPKDSRWYIITIGIGASFIVISIILKNFLFSVFILLALFSFTLLGARKPKILSYSIDDIGIRAGKTLYPFETLESFWIRKEDDGNLLVLQSSQTFAPYVFIPIGSENPTDIKEFLKDSLHEHPHPKGLLETFEEFIGF
jgi:hypothetical protein